MALRKNTKERIKMTQVGITKNDVAMENTYYLYNDKAQIIVDPGNDTEQILGAIIEVGLPVAAVILTHTHYDHIMSVEALREHFGMPVYVSELEKDWLGDPMMNLSGRPNHDDMEDVIVQPADIIFENYKEYDIEGMKFKVVPTPGHSIGGVSFIFDEFVVTGDALFKGGIGRYDLPTGDLDMLLDGIRRELFTLDYKLTALPGHGDPTTIGAEAMYNPFFN
jgi:glyoxylase-like metal-dependent hydrolase (beta-lactamase superfamily II)